MATIWKQTAAGFAAQGLPRAGGTAADEGADACWAGRDFRIVPFRDGSAPAYALLTPADVPARVNGSPVAGGIRILRHKDEMIVGSVRMFFSAESTPVVETYRHQGSGRRPRCPTCRNEALDLQTVVCCPGCARIYHQLPATDDAPAKPCWTYSPRCRFCGHPTSLSGEHTW